MAKFGLTIILLFLLSVILAEAAFEFTKDIKTNPLSNSKASPFLRNGLISPSSRHDMDSPFKDNRFPWFARNFSRNQRRNRMEALIPIIKYIRQRKINKSTTFSPSTIPDLYEPTIEGSGA